MTLATATPARAPVEEIRLAVVLNGGVSLAVWMGGVVQELDRLPRRGASTARRWLAAAQALPRAADLAASGDEFFLEQLDIAMTALSSAFKPTGRPVDLTLATTLLDGVHNVTVDVLGQRDVARRRVGCLRPASPARGPAPPRCRSRNQRQHLACARVRERS